jgi:hypothetical protein
MYRGIRVGERSHHLGTRHTPCTHKDAQKESVRKVAKAGVRVGKEGGGGVGYKVMNPVPSVSAAECARISIRCASNSGHYSDGTRGGSCSRGQSTSVSKRVSVSMIQRG